MTLANMAEAVLSALGMIGFVLLMCIAFGLLAVMISDYRERRRRRQRDKRFKRWIENHHPEQ